MEEKRTQAQNNSLHLYFSQIAKQMSDAGYTVQHILDFTADLQPTPSFVKRLWQEIQLRVLDKRHTHELKKQEEIDRVYEEFNLFLAEKLNLENIPFPSLESLEDKKQH